jgi:hypothetical protein
VLSCVFVMTSYEHLLRFKNTSGEIWFGNISTELVSQGSFVGSTVPVSRSDNPWKLDFENLGQRETIAEVSIPRNALCVDRGNHYHASELEQD